MEFPSDIFNIIREYSRMRYVKEYNEAMRALGMTEWKLVQDKLKTDEADKVLAALQAYTTAEVELENIRKIEESDSFNSREVTLRTFPRLEKRWDQRLRNHAEICVKTSIRNRLNVELCYMLIGKENYCTRWLKNYEEDEEELEDGHIDMLYRYNQMYEEYYDRENAYELVRMLYDN